MTQQEIDQFEDACMFRLLALMIACSAAVAVAAIIAGGNEEKCGNEPAEEISTK